MNILNFTQGKRIYLDANIWVYALEGYPEFSPLITNLFAQIDQGHFQAVTSELTISEVLVKPFRDQNQDLQVIYQSTLQSSDILQVTPINQQVLIETAKLRANINMKLPDAIHLATASLTGCETFLTNDKRIKSIGKLKVIQISDLL